MALRKHQSKPNNMTNIKPTNQLVSEIEEKDDDIKVIIRKVVIENIFHQARQQERIRCIKALEGMNEIVVNPLTKGGRNIMTGFKLAKSTAIAKLREGERV